MSKPWGIRLERRGEIRKLRRYLIVSEDAKSGLDYLLSFKVPSKIVQIESEGGAGNTISVVERALKLREQAIRSKSPYVQVWCVIDRDEHPLERYRSAFRLAKDYPDVTVIWANECFEIWYLMHFCYRDTSIGRGALRKELEKPAYLNRPYDKADSEVFELLRDRRDAAIKNARRLSQSNRSNEVNPSTNLHELVETLLRLQSADQP
jgi:hypothetical protein